MRDIVDNILAEACALTKLAAGPARIIRASCWNLPRVECAVFYNPLEEHTHITFGERTTEKEAAAWEERFLPVLPNTTAAPVGILPANFSQQPWLFVKASNSLLRNKPYRDQDLHGVLDSYVKVAAAIASGLLNITSNWPFLPEDDPECFTKSASDLTRNFHLLGVEKPAFQMADSVQGLDLVGKNMPTIDRDSFGRTVWHDPFTHEAIRAATVGLVNSASMAAGGSPFVNPYDVARVTPNINNGLQVGITLANMANMSPQQTQAAQSSGAWSRMLTAVVPSAFLPSERVFHF